MILSRCVVVARYGSMANTKYADPAVKSGSDRIQICKTEGASRVHFITGHKGFICPHCSLNSARFMSLYYLAKKEYFISYRSESRGGSRILSRVRLTENLPLPPKQYKGKKGTCLFLGGVCKMCFQQTTDKTVVIRIHTM